MKKIFTLLLFVYALTPAKAQTLTITPADSVASIDTATSDFTTINDIIFLHNTSADTITIKWRLASDTIPGGWGILFCDNQNCYNLPTTPKTSLPIAPGDSIDMHAEFTPACTSGQGTMRILTSITGSTEPAITLTYHTSVTAICATGINTISENALQLYPNPASSQISISGLNYGHNINIQIIDLQGRVINTQSQIAGNLVTANVANLPAGMYLVKLLDVQSNVTSTKRFTKF